jgi:hypothetical protein
MTQQPKVKPVINKVGKQIGEYVPIVTKSKNDYYKYHLMDCNTDDQEVIKTLPYCSAELRPQLPALVILCLFRCSLNPTLMHTIQSPGNSTKPSNINIKGNLMKNHCLILLRNPFIYPSPLIKGFSSKITKMQQWNTFSKANSQVPTILYFTDKDKLPVIYKILTAHFRNTIAFAHAPKDSPLALHFNISKYPTMLLNGKEEITLSKNLQEMIDNFN